jgi:protein TonB
MSNNIIFDRPNYSNSDSLILALFVAIIVHIIVGMTVKFTTPHVDKISRSSIDVTLTQTPAKKAPKKAKFLAPDNQEGAGNKIKKARPPAQKLPSHAEKTEPHEKPVKKIHSETKEAQEIKHQAAPKAVVRKKSEKKIVTAAKPVVAHKVEERPHIDAETLRQQIAQLGSEIRYNPQGSDDNKSKTLAQVSAHKFVAAQYIRDWESKVERTGNLNFPAVAAKKGSNTLTMDVGIKADGSINNIRIRKSSGNAALDEAAKNIVKMSAPFAPLPSALLKELRILVITRKWKFSDESGMTTP